MKNTGKYEQQCHNFIDDYANDRVNKYGFFCLDNNMSDTMEQKITPGPFQVLLDNIIAENDEKWKYEHVREFDFVLSMKSKQSVLV